MDAGGDEPTVDASDDGGGGVPCGINTVVNDPSFMNPAAWTATGGAHVDPAAMGSTDLGVGVITIDDGTLAQSVCVAAPPSDRGLALIVEAVVDKDGEPRVRTAVGSEVRTENNWSQAFSTLTQCLGEVTYNTTANVQLAGVNIKDVDAVRFDDLRIAQVSTATCPAVGTVLSGDFENAAAWNNSVYIEGAAGSRFAHLRTGSTPPYGCNYAAVSGMVSVPKNLANSALTFEVRGSLTTNSVFNVYAYGPTNALLLSLNGLSSSTQIGTACVPAAMRGHVLDITLGISQSPAGMCPTPMEAFIDNVTITSAPSLCP